MTLPEFARVGLYAYALAFASTFAAFLFRKHLRPKLWPVAALCWPAWVVWELFLAERWSR